MSQHLQIRHHYRQILSLEAVKFSILLNSRAALAFTSAFTITPEPIAAVPLDIVISPDIPPSM